MSRLDFGKTKDKISIIENAKDEKRTQMRNLYSSLTKNQEFLDLLMIQIGKDIEEKFPGVKFRLISRIKTENSFSDKLENDLVGLVDKKRIEDVKIYDVIALSIIIEDVPDNIKANDSSFDSHMEELIGIRKDSKLNLELHQNELNEYKSRIELLQEKSINKLKWKEENDKKLQEISEIEEDIFGIKDHLLKVSEDLEKDIADIDEQINNLLKDVKNMKTIVRRTKDRYEKENNECNHALADFIIKNLTKFDNVKTIGLMEVPRRLKQKENYDGYRAVHNCYDAKIKVKNKDGKDEDFYFVCEIQGKSIDAFYVADRGKAARYHTNQKKEPGKIVKEKVLPDILKVNTPEEIEEFRKEVVKKVPAFRIYRHINEIDENGQKSGRPPEVYKLSLKESFMLYYYNQLFGNKELKIEAEKERLDELVDSNKLPDNDYRVYRNYDYRDLG